MRGGKHDFRKNERDLFLGGGLELGNHVDAVCKFDLSCAMLLRMLMHADNGGVDHLDSRHHGWQQVHLYTGPPPANKAVVASGAGTKRFR
jgi:hypothetical protein